MDTEREESANAFQPPAETTPSERDEIQRDRNTEHFTQTLENTTGTHTHISF